MPDQRLEQAKRAIQEMAKAERFSVPTPSSSSTPSPAPGSSRSVSQTTPPQQSSSPSLGKSSTAIKRGINTTPKHVRFQDTVSQESIGAEPKIEQQRVEKTRSLDYLVRLSSSCASNGEERPTHTVTAVEGFSCSPFLRMSRGQITQAYASRAGCGMGRCR
jgi:hypothetical protein